MMFESGVYAAFRRARNMTIRVILSKVIIENGPLLRVLRHIPGFRLGAERLAARILPAGYRGWFQVRNGVGKDIWLKLNPRSGSQYYLGRADTHLQRILQDCLKPGMVFYDLGSNTGFFALIAARIVGSAGKVVAFEAEPRLGNDLLENVRRNSAHNVRVVQVAVWSSSGFVGFSPVDQRISPDLGTGHVLSDPTTKTVCIPSISLDDFVQTERPPDLIKCDVEGAEVQVFRGAMKVLTEFKPCIECEVHSDENGKLLYATFEEMDYNVEWYSPGHLFAVPREPRTVGKPK